MTFRTIDHHQVGDGFTPVPAAWFGECPERMDTGLLGVEFETHGRIAPTVGKYDICIAFSGKVPEFRAKTDQFISHREIDLSEELKSDRLLITATVAIRSCLPQRTQANDARVSHK
jgi:hypothetical protein